MSYTVTEATVVFPDKKAASSFSSGYASKKPCAHIDCELEGGFERSIWIPVRVARLYVKNRPDLPCDWDNFREAVQLIERKCALTMVTEMLSRRDHATGEVRDKLARYGFRQTAIDFAVERATEYRFLDENRFCSYFIEERKRRGWGQRKIETELKPPSCRARCHSRLSRGLFCRRRRFGACVSPARQAACSRDARIRKTGSVFDGQGLLVSHRRRCR